MAQTDTVVRDIGALTAAEEAALDQALTNLRGGLDQDLIRSHAAAGISMFGTDPRYPGELVELAPDGRRFIVHRDGDMRVRLRQVE